MTRINIPRAIAEDRKILFSHAARGKVYYDTVFGEQFAIYLDRRVRIARVALARDYVSYMQEHNERVSDE